MTLFDNCRVNNNEKYSMGALRDGESEFLNVQIVAATDDIFRLIKSKLQNNVSACILKCHPYTLAQP